MHFRCEKKDLVEGISTVQKAIQGKSTMQVLEGIYIETTSEGLILRGTDIDLSIETKVPAIVVEDGTIVIDSKLFGEIVRKLPNSEVDVVTTENNTITVTCENSIFNLLFLNADDFPDLPEIGRESGVEIKESLLKNLISGTNFAVAQDEARPILMGVLFEVKNSVLNMVALDGYRLALRTENLDSVDDFSVVIPGKTLNEVNKILSDSTENVNISFNDNHIMFKIKDTKIVSRLLSGDFIKYESILPTDYRLSFTTSKAVLHDSIERASLMSKDGTSNLIKMNIDGGRMVITSNSQFGKVREELSITSKGEPIEIAFNSRYLIDVLKVIEEDEILFEMTSSVSPCIIKNRIKDNCKYLVLPVRIAR
ncbi:DNA polymerase III subunit beta [Youngiibacter multivorans]|uniref:Beta sliding clamp n=1 Tax=Youngiibacter multivorans TaxID=937251 RepID=A0ABS4FZ09_9CLOT|nr:DNA polymerase III subunit beta [Youngiibacter multivorans]MBP1917543.1 DNA polymerase-3 subunit beta [Youngiibacter multivorans]